MTYEILLNLFSLMPRCFICINPNFETVEPMPYVFQNFQEGLTIPSGGSNESPSPQERSHPARKIQTLSMLARRRNSKGLTTFCPSPAQSRMQAKTCLILKDNRLLWLKGSEFFLTTDESAWHPQNGPEHTHSWHASSDNPTDASNTALAEPSNSLRNTSSNEPLTWAHPNGRATSRTLADFVQGDPPIAEQPPRSAAPDDQAGVLVTKSPHHFRSRPGSSDLSSCGLDLTIRLSQI